MCVRRHRNNCKCEEVTMRLYPRVTLCVFMLGSAALAQTARITGRVTDRTGAVVPGTSITVTNSGTGAERKVTTSEEGYYTVPLLLPGEYRVTGEHEVFRP